MSSPDLKSNERSAAAAATDVDASSLGAVPQVKKPKIDPDAALQIASEGDTLEEDDLEIDGESLPVFDTHGNRNLG